MKNENKKKEGNFFKNIVRKTKNSFFKILGITNKKEGNNKQDYWPGIVFSRSCVESFQGEFIDQYMKNSVAILCVQYITNNIRRFGIQSNFNNYFPQINIYKLMEDIIHDFIIYGNCFLYLKRDFDTQAYSLHLLETKNVFINHNKDTITNFEYHYKSKKITLEKERVIHLKNRNPLSNLYGSSYLYPILVSIKQYNALNEYMSQLAQRGGVMSGIIISKNLLNNEDRRRMSEQIQSFYSRINNQGSVMVLEGDCSWEKVSLSPQDLDLKQLLNQSASAIARGFGISPVLIGLGRRGGSGYSGLQYIEVRKQFFQDTLFPLYEKILDSFADQIQNIIKNKITVSLRLAKENTI